MSRGLSLLSDIAFYRTYSRVLPSGKKETWQDVCDRYQQFWLDYLPTQHHDLIVQAVNFVRQRKVVPSMRMMQFAGEPVRRENLRAFNCCFLPMTCLQNAAELLYLAACGTGVGYSIQRHHTETAEAVGMRPGFRTFAVEDSRESWADSIPVLLESPDVQFDYSRIRPQGTPLSTGGTASGPAPLMQCHERIREVVRTAQGRRLTPFEWHVVLTSIGDAIVSGGVRRTALIALFDRDDKEMLAAKSGDWWEKYPQFARANNSAVLPRQDVTEEEFRHILQRTFDSNAGEPGLSWTLSKEHGYNPCVSGDIELLTKQGYQRIDSLVGQEVEVWNGFEFSKVIPAVTGHNQPMVKVTLSNGRSLRCTTAHKWVVVEGYEPRQTQQRLRADQLKLGMKLLKHEYPVLEGGPTLPQAYTQGFIAADGMDDYNFLWLYEPKYMCESRLSGSIVGTEYKNNNNTGRKKLMLDFEPLPKTFVPLDYSVQSRLDWLAGLLDGDGTELKEGGAQIVSVDQAFLLSVQKMLTTLGVASKVTQGQDAGMRALPDGSGSLKDFHCQASYRICIGATQMQHLKKLGLNCERLSFNKFPNRDASQFVKVVGLEEAGYEETVYCFTEPLRNLGCFDGVVTGQCHEISLRGYQTCNLTEVNVPACNNIADFLDAAHAGTVLGTLQSLLDNYNYVNPMWRFNAQEERLLGLSLTGQAQAQRLLQPHLLRTVAESCKELNGQLAEGLGIRPAARITTTKPSGTTSSVLGTSAGVHGVHAPFYVRRVGVEVGNPLEVYLRRALPAEFWEECTYDPSLTLFKLPVKMPGIVRTEETALQLLERTKSLYDNWVVPGHRSGPNTHNVSLTVSYREEEKEDIMNWMWENRAHYAGISLLPFDNGSYKQAPYTTCTAQEYLDLEAALPEVNLHEVLYEQLDDSRTQTAACDGPTCEIRNNT